MYELVKPGEVLVNNAVILVTVATLVTVLLLACSTNCNHAGEILFMIMTSVVIPPDWRVGFNSAKMVVKMKSLCVALLT